MPTSEVEKVLRFWFPSSLRDEHAVMVCQFDWWFRAGADSEIGERFSPIVEHAARGELDDWNGAPRSRLALIIVLDQFSRSLFRGTPRAFAQDPKALASALEGIERGHYAALSTPWEKMFFSMPLAHSEELSNLEAAVELVEELASEATLGNRRVLEHSVSQARGHRDVVARFGRHPHRNAILGRQSTPEELEYLDRGEFVHLRRAPR